jgi:hypothetical protein
LGPVFRPLFTGPIFVVGYGYGKKGVNTMQFWQAIIRHKSQINKDELQTTRTMSDYDALMAFVGQHVIDIYASGGHVTNVEVKET